LEYNIIQRPALIGIIDLNPTICKENAGMPCGDHSATNPDYWREAKKILGPLQIGQSGEGLGFINQGMDFAANYTAGPPPNSTVYAANPMENAVYRIKYTYDLVAKTVSWQMEDPAIKPLNIPTDVKVQKVEVSPNNFINYAYITNAGDDTVSIIDTAHPDVYYDPFFPDVFCVDRDHYPTSIDTRVAFIGGGKTQGYSSDFHSNTVSVYDLPLSQMNSPICEIDVGPAPIRIVVQPVPTNSEIFGVLRNSLAFAQPTDFTTPSKQSNLIRDWENVQQLEETSANPQAVVANINAFQNNMKNWVANAALKKSVDDGVNLYRAAYIHDHPVK
jgi:DNA-binding beta-propeller fold protein YncE